MKNHTSHTSLTESRRNKRLVLIGIIAIIHIGSSIRNVHAMAKGSERAGSGTFISNPFYGFDPPGGNNDHITLRSKKGDRSVELELGGKNSSMTDFVIPVSPQFPNVSESNSVGSIDTSYKERAPGVTDREITRSLTTNENSFFDERREIETGLGLTPSEDLSPISDQSYLAATDHIKQLYKAGRFEAALIELDDLIRAYPTDPKLYEMRGTLLDRSGHGEMALKSWSQALRLDPNNSSLKRFIERKQQTRRIASPATSQP